ncbi:uncharacterized protein J5F26_010187 [Ciconia maguari]
MEEELSGRWEIPSADVKPQACPAQRRASCSGQQWTPKEFRTGQAPPAVSSEHPPSLQQLVASHLPATVALPGGKSCKTAWSRATRHVQLPSTGYAVAYLVLQCLLPRYSTPLFGTVLHDTESLQALSVCPRFMHLPTPRRRDAPPWANIACDRLLLRLPTLNVAE